jgi:hypothetical protein
MLNGYIIEALRVLLDNDFEFFSRKIAFVVSVYFVIVVTNG